MPKTVNGGEISEEAAAVLALLQKASGRRRSQIVSEALEKLGLSTFGRPITITHVHKTQTGWFNGWFANSFNHWRTKILVALRARIPDWLNPETIPRFILVLGGAVGAVYLLTMLGAF
jgi:hypothetical protein